MFSRINEQWSKNYRRYRTFCWWILKWIMGNIIAERTKSSSPKLGWWSGIELMWETTEGMYEVIELKGNKISVWAERRRFRNGKTIKRVQKNLT